VRDATLALIAGLLLLVSHARHGWPGRDVLEIRRAVAERGARLTDLERLLLRVDQRVPRHDPVAVRFVRRLPARTAELARWNARSERSPRADPGATFARLYLGPRPIAMVGDESDARATEIVQSARWLVVIGEHAPPDGYRAVLADGSGALYERAP